MARELLLAIDAAPRKQAVARDEPRRGREPCEDQESHHRPVRAGAVREGWWSERRVRPPADEAEELEEQRNEEPEEHAATEAPERRQEPDAASSEEREEVDRRYEERQQRGDEHDLDRPAAHDPRAEPDVRGRPLRQLEALVERCEELLRGAADLAEPCSALRRLDEARCVTYLARRTVAGRGDRQRRDAVPEQRRLLVRAEREGEIEELSQGTRALRLAASLLEHAGRRRRKERAARNPRSVARELESRCVVSGDRVEVDGGGHIPRERRVVREMSCADAAERAAVCREEHERVRRRHAARGGRRCRGARRARVRPGQLDQRGGARGIVVRTGSGAAVVTMGDKHDRRRASARARPRRDSRT